MEFLHMGGYAAYVWSAYGITLAVLLFNIWSARRRNTATLERVKQAATAPSQAPRATVRQIS
jgi:heme exporter protein D